ncbi:MAG: ATP-binding protein [Verrucomicrobiota bacterium]
MSSGLYRFCGILCVLAIMCGTRSSVLAQDGLPAVSLAQMRELAASNERLSITFRLEGDVRAIGREARLVTLDDGATTDIVELPSLPDGLQVGDHVVIEGSDCLLARGRLALCLGTAPLVDIAGHHSELMRTGKVFLREGMWPLRLEWFNGDGPAALKVEYEADGVPRQQVPPEMFAHATENGGYEAGLEYSCYPLADLGDSPNFEQMEPEMRGIVAVPDSSVRTRAERVGVVYSGVLRLPRTGVYRFFLTSDDGARLYLAKDSVTCRIAGQGNAARGKPVSWGRTRNNWVALEGTVVFAAKSDESLELEISGNSDTVRAVVADAAGLDPMKLIHQRVKLTGVARDSGIVALGREQVELIEEKPGGEKVLTRAVEVRQLQPDDKVSSYRAAIQGVVTMTSPRSLVIQDATGGVFAHFFSEATENTPEPGEVWLIEGRASQGGFSPVIYVDKTTFMGEGPLPKAVQPTQAQLASGSLDAERVEIEGVVISVSAAEMVLLTRAGRVKISSGALYPLATEALPEDKRQSLIGGVVRVRGVYRATWDAAGSVVASEFSLGNAQLTVDMPASDDLFSGVLMRPADLLRFTSHPTALRRVRVRGQVLYSNPPQLWLNDGGQGFRVTCREAMPLRPGTEVEVSGFPQLGGPSPALLEAVVRETGSSPLPEAQKVPFWNLPDLRLDATRVVVEATVLSDTVRQEERALEMRAGTSRFIAVMPVGVELPQRVERDSVLRLTGVYVAASPDRTTAGSDAFELRLGSPADVVVVMRGPWWTGRHTMLALGLLSLGLLLAVAWVSLLRRTVTRRSNELAVEIEERETVERHRALEQERSRMAQDLHDELGAGLTEAGILSSLARNPGIPDKDKAGYLDQLNGLCCSLVTSLDEIVWAVNPRYDSVADLAGYFSLQAQRFLQLAGIDCRLDIDEAITRDPLDSRTRQSILLAFKEALNNTVRHSSATEVRLTVRVEAALLVICLVDDGCGFEPHTGKAPGSDGLRNMEGRILQLGGTCDIESTPGVGTTVRFKIPLQDRTP